LDKYNDFIKIKKYAGLLNILPKFYIFEYDCQPDEKDIEPGIGRHDIKILLKNKGDLFEIKKLLMWKKSEKVFEKWMLECLKLKQKGEDMNTEEKMQEEKKKAEEEKKDINMK